MNPPQIKQPIYLKHACLKQLLAQRSQLFDPTGIIAKVLHCFLVSCSLF